MIMITLWPTDGKTGDDIVECQGKVYRSRRSSAARAAARDLVAKGTPDQKIEARYRNSGHVAYTVKSLHAFVKRVPVETPLLRFRKYVEPDFSRLASRARDDV